MTENGFLPIPARQVISNIAITAKYICRHTVQLERKSSYRRKYSSTSEIIACIYCCFKYLLNMVRPAQVPLKPSGFLIFLLKKQNICILFYLKKY